jgi:NF-X1-type zinc finger protein NFXL1
VKYTCPCRRLKREFPCDVVRRGQAKVDCDDVCKQKKEEEIKVYITVFLRFIQVKLEVTG